MKGRAKLAGLITILTVLLGATVKNVFSSGGVQTVTGSRVAPRNFVLILYDEWGTDKNPLYYASSGALTPNFDTYAATGVRFLNAFAAPTCSPGRASLVTGKYPRDHGVGTAIVQSNPDLASGLDPSIPTVFDVLQEYGYYTAMIGKLHLAGVEYDPSLYATYAHSVGFDYWEGTKGNFGVGLNYENFEWYENDDSFAVETTYLITHTTDRAIANIPANGPFAMVVSHNAVHSPLHCPDDSLTPTYNATCDPVGGETADQAEYYAMLEALDGENDRLISALDLATTTVCIAGDNGTDASVIEGFDSDEGKGTAYLGGVKVPLICFGDQVTDTGTVTAPVNFPDFAKTILDIAGISHSELPTATDSVSFFPTFADASATPRTINYTEGFTPNGYPANPTADWIRSASITGYHLIRLANGSEVMFDTVADPLETGAGLNLGSLTAPQQAAYNLLKNKIDYP